MPRLRTLLVALIGAGLAYPAVAPATLDPIPTVDPGDANPSRPDKPCYTLGRTTGYQAKAGTTRSLYTVQKEGRLVQGEIKLTKLTDKQIAFFDKSLGGESQAAVS